MFQCRDLLTLPSLSKAKLLAGANGMANGIRWVYKPESMHFAKWVKGRELMIISTPVIQSKDFNLEKLMYEAVKLNMSGVILLVGEHYIDKISREVISYANEKKFPLFSISGEIPLIDIFEEIGHAIAYYDNKEEAHEDVLSQIIFGNDRNVEGVHLKCELLDYDLTPPQVIFVLHLYTAEYVDAYDKRIIGETLKQLFTKRDLPLLLSKYSNSYVGLVPQQARIKEQCREIFEELMVCLKDNYPTLECLMGLGKGYEKLERLQLSFREASRCITLANQMGKRNMFYDYTNLAFFNLLYELENTELISEFIESAIGPLLRYDEKKQSELIKTLKVYIENNCSLLNTAEKLHTHRNTVKYRVGRIEEIIGKDMSWAMNRLEVMNAILCYELYGRL